MHTQRLPVADFGISDRGKAYRGACRADPGANTHTDPGANTHTDAGAGTEARTHTGRNAVSLRTSKPGQPAGERGVPRTERVTRCGGADRDPV